MLSHPSQIQHFFISHYSRTYLKKRKANGMEWLSFSERVHPRLQSGGRLFQGSKS
jgi:hypothetical protein